MLSTTSTITSVKLKLKNTYAFFDYTSDALFVADLTSVADDVKRVFFYPRIGKAEYDRIALKNNVGLTETEEYLFWAEVFTICSEFLKWFSAKTEQLRTSANERLTVEGYTHQISTGAGASPGELSLKFYKDMMHRYWKLAGYDIMALERTCNIFGEGNDSFFGRTIIE